MAKQLLNAPVIGVVENMAAYVCADCGKTEDLFPSGHTEEMTHQFDVSLLGKIPFDPRISIASDEGSVFVDRYRDTPAGQTFFDITDKIRTFFE